MNLTIRDCAGPDLAATLAIFNELMLTTTVAWRDEPFSFAARTQWFIRQQERGFPGAGRLR